MLLTLTLVVCAACYGAVAGALLPRTVYRFAVGREQPRPTSCPRGHPLPLSLRGWAGPARCARCTGSTRTVDSPRSAQYPEETASAEDAPPAPYADVTEHADVTEYTGHTEDADDTGYAGDTETRGSHGASPGSTRGAYGSRTLPLLLSGAAVCAALAGSVGPRPELAVWLLIVPSGLLLAAVDIRVRRLPDVLTLPLAAATAALLAVAAAVPGAGGSWVRALLGGAVLASVYFVLFLVHPRGLGFGDVKLALTAGVALGWYGWQPLLAGAFLGFLLHAGYGVALMLAGRAGRRTALPFGPFMFAGAVLGVVTAAAGA